MIEIQNLIIYKMMRKKIQIKTIAISDLCVFIYQSNKKLKIGLNLIKAFKTEENLISVHTVIWLIGLQDIFYEWGAIFYFLGGFLV